MNKATLFNFMNYDFHQLSPLGGVGHIVAMSVCVSVCMCVPLQNTHFRRLKKFWLKGVSLILACNEIFFFFFFSVMMIFCVFLLLHFSTFQVFGATLLWIILLCIMGEYEGEDLWLWPLSLVTNYT